MTLLAHTLLLSSLFISISCAADAPQLDSSDTFENGDRRRRGSFVGPGGATPPMLDSPEFVRAGVRKYDMASPVDRRVAKQSYDERKSGSTPNNSGHNMNNFTPSQSPAGQRASGFGSDTSGAANLASTLSQLSPNDDLTRPPESDSFQRMSQARQSAFRERRLSKDIIHDEDGTARDAEEAVNARSASSSPSFKRERQVTRDIDQPAMDRPSEPLLNDGERAQLISAQMPQEKTYKRRISLDEMVAIEAEEEAEGSPNPIDAIARVIDQAEVMEVKASVSGRPSKEDLHTGRRLSKESFGRPSKESITSDESGENNADTPSKRRIKPSEQPRTAVKTGDAWMQNRPSVMISEEMGSDVVRGVQSSFDPALVGSYSCHGQEPGSNGAEAKINQDCACVGHPFAGLRGTACFAVYDGHGRCGHDVSQEAMHTIFHMLEEAGDELADDPGGTLADAFEACNVHLRLMACEPEIEVNALESGTCATVAFMYLRELFVASVGDCRCILGARDTEAPGGVAVVPLSQDHKVNLPVEQARIESKGGYVRPERVDPDGEFVPARMYEVQGKPWIGPGLCISRALGDLNALRCGLIPTPEVYSHTVRDEHKFIILASDGVWYARDRCLLSPHSHPPILRRTRTS